MQDPAHRSIFGVNASRGNRPGRAIGLAKTGSAAAREGGDGAAEVEEMVAATYEGSCLRGRSRRYSSAIDVAIALIGN
jgi:hypothetical protein